MFITFEGLDFSGKSTQVQLIVEKLGRENYNVLVLRDPGGTPIGERIRSILLDKELSDMADFAELFLFSASRSQLVKEVIRPALEGGMVVICDRFYDSTTAYQGWGRGLPIEDIKTINRAAADGLVPDVTLFIDIPVPEIERRMNQQKSKADRMESSGIAFYERVRQGYMQLANEETRFLVVNGLQPVDDIHEAIWLRVQQHLAVVQNLNQTKS
ncbi:MAG TPA: dTMP kinase [Bacteroidetes bacterium]|nr:dTMP kinase [Bacteroidota bacterium]